MEKIFYYSESFSSFYNSTTILFMFTKIQDLIGQQRDKLSVLNNLDSYLEEIADTIVGKGMVRFLFNRKLSLV